MITYGGEFSFPVFDIILSSSLLLLFFPLFFCPKIMIGRKFLLVLHWLIMLDNFFDYYHLKENFNWFSLTGEVIIIQI
jgi:hypothetical protein